MFNLFNKKISIKDKNNIKNIVFTNNNISGNNNNLSKSIILNTSLGLNSNINNLQNIFSGNSSNNQNTAVDHGRNQSNIGGNIYNLSNQPHSKTKDKNN